MDPMNLKGGRSRRPGGGRWEGPGLNVMHAARDLLGRFVLSRLGGPGIVNLSINQSINRGLFVDTGGRALEQAELFHLATCTSGIQ